VNCGALKIIPRAPALLGSATVTTRSTNRSSLVAVSLILAATGAQADPSSTSPEKGYDLGEVQSPRSVAMGGALNAVGTSTTSLYLNPANLALARVYHFEVLTAISPEARRQSYGGAVVDSSTSRLAGGFSGVWSQLDPDGIHRQWTDLRLALAYPLGDKIALGMTGRYLRVDQGVAAGPFGASLVSDGTRDGPLYNSFTFDAGITVVPIDELRLGLVGHNLTNPGTGIAPTTLAGGVGFTQKDLAIEADLLGDFTTWSRARPRFMLGGELFVADHFPIRLGYRYDDGSRTHALSTGLGYVDKKWSIEVSARRDIIGELPATLVSIGIRYFYDTLNVPTDEPDAF
jgi:hypothetical protein